MTSLGVPVRLFARVTRRRFERLLRRVAPPPMPRSYAETARSLSPVGAGELRRVDEAVSTDFHTPRAVAALYGALRRRELPSADREILAAVAHRLFLPDSHLGRGATAPMAPTSPPGPPGP